MNWDFKVLKQWFSLLLGKSEVRYISPEWIKEHLVSLTYLDEEIWVQEGLYVPATGVLQLVATVPSSEHVQSEHTTKENFVRVMTQDGFLAAWLSPLIPDSMKELTSVDYNQTVYYVQETTRWRRMVRQGDPFVFTIRVQNARQVGNDGSMIFSLAMADGPFEGTIRAAYLPGHTDTLASTGLEKYCQSIWHTMVESMFSKFAFSLTRSIIKATRKSSFFLP